MITTAKTPEVISIPQNKVKLPNSPTGAKIWCTGEVDASANCPKVRQDMTAHYSFVMSSQHLTVPDTIPGHPGGPSSTAIPQKLVYNTSQDLPECQNSRKKQ